MKNAPSLQDNNVIVDCIQRLINDKNLRRVTAYRNPKLTIKATRLHKDNARALCASFVVSIGVPNWAERKRIASVGKPFSKPFLHEQVWPVKKVKKAKKK